MTLQEIELIYVEQVSNAEIKEKNVQRIEFVKQLQKKQMKQGNFAEKKFEKVLKDNKINYESQTFLVCANRYTNLIYHIYLADFFIPDLNLDIEIDGNYHKPEYNAKRDEALSLSGFEVLRLNDSFSDLQANIVAKGIKTIAD